jgi:hypothetical protein
MTSSHHKAASFLLTHNGALIAVIRWTIIRAASFLMPGMQ